jgi:DNA-binding Lrp family transcriptional regulator
MRISAREGSILATNQFQADQPVVEIARQLRIQPHAAHYTLRKYRDSGVLRRGALIDFARLGYSLYQLYFSLSSTGIKRKEKILKFLATHPRVNWFGTLGGSFQYGVSFFVRNTLETQRFLLDLSQVAKSGIGKKELGVIHNLHFLNKTYLAPKSKKKRERISIQSSSEQLELDQKDQKIVAALFRKSSDSAPEISQLTGLPRTTVEYRLKRLTEEKILLRHIYYISAQKLGFLVYRILIRSRGLCDETNKLVLAFAEKSSNVVAVAESIGAFECELTVEVASADQAVSIAEDLMLHLGESVEDIDILPVFSQSTSVRLFDES